MAQLHITFWRMETPRELVPCLTEAQMHVRMLLEQDDDFLHSSTFREQCARACILCRLPQTPLIPFTVIAEVFNVTHATLCTHWRVFRKRGNGIGDGGRPAALPLEAHDGMTEAIIQSYRIGQPFSLSSIQKIVRL